MTILDSTAETEEALRICKEYNCELWQWETYKEIDKCPHQYEERSGGCKCIRCGHFVGNWEG